MTTLTYIEEKIKVKKKWKTSALGVIQNAKLVYSS